MFLGIFGNDLKNGKNWFKFPQRPDMSIMCPILATFSVFVFKHLTNKLIRLFNVTFLDIFKIILKNLQILAKNWIKTAVFYDLLSY